MCGKVSVDFLREHLTYDPVSGVLHYIKSPYRSIRVGDRAGYNDGRYWRIEFKGRRYQLHQVIWALVTGQWSDKLIDHKNRDKGDNTWDNLREATYKENQRNREKNPNSSTGYKGVSYFVKSDRYVAQLEEDGKRIYLGSFKDKHLAAEAYNKYVKENHGEFAVLNVIEEQVILPGLV